MLNTKIDHLTDGYLDGVFELVESRTKKNKLVEEKKGIEEKLSDFERKGNHWLELRDRPQAGKSGAVKLTQIQYGGPSSKNLEPLFDIILDWAPKLKKVYQAQEDKTRLSLGDI